MFYDTSPDPSPLGVRLGDLMAMLAPTSIKATLKDNVLLARHEHYTIRLEVVPPDDRESENGPIQAVVRMVTDLPTPIQSLFKGQDASLTAAYNSFAALGALFTDGGNVKIGARLTIYEAEDAWGSLHLPLLLFTTICGTEAILGALRRTMANEGQRGGISKWTEDDFALVEKYLSKICLCSTGGLGFTAEFGLQEDAISAAAGDHKTALFQLMADQPHPELGGGLFSLLQMPHRLDDERRLHQVCLQLNNMEMAAHDLPPHFGAWCPGKIGNNPAYVSFFPNALHSVSGIAVNASIWAMNRAQWANAMLASLGVPSRFQGRDTAPNSEPPEIFLTDPSTDPHEQEDLNTADGSEAPGNEIKLMMEAMRAHLAREPRKIINMSEEEMTRLEAQDPRLKRIKIVHPDGRVEVSLAHINPKRRAYFEDEPSKPEDTAPPIKNPPERADTQSSIKPILLNRIKSVLGSGYRPQSLEAVADLLIDTRLSAINFEDLVQRIRKTEPAIMYSLAEKLATMANGYFKQEGNGRP